MRIRSFLSSSTVLSVLIASTALVSDAQAQKGVTMMPSSDWAITRAAGNDGGGYCAMARRFKQNTILTIARNQLSESSVALDFQRARLDDGKLYTAILDPGAGQQRAYEVRPVSSKAFVVRLGRDTAFFQALARTGHLRVEIGNQSYSFSLADIDAGQFKLDSCLANAVAPAAGVETAQDDGGVRYRQELNALRLKVQTLKDENSRLSGLIEEGGEVLDSSPAISRLSEQVTGLEEENKALRAKLASLTTDKVATVRSAADEAELETLRQENISLKAQLQASAGVDGALVETLQARVDELKLENKRLTEIADLANQSLGAEDKEMLAKLGEENSRLQAALDARAQESLDTGALDDQISALRAENEELKMQLAQAPALDTQEQDEKIQALKDENARLRQSLEEQNLSASLVSEFEQQLATLETQNAELKTRIENVKSEAQAGFDEQLQKVRSENTELKAALDKKGVDAGLLEQLRLQIGQMENENRLLQETAAKAQKDLEAQKQAELEAIQGAGEEEAKAREEKIAGLEKSMAELNAALQAKDSELVALAAQATELEALKTKNSELEAKIMEGVGEQEAVASLEQKIEALEAENTSLKDQVASAEASTQAENEELRQQLSEAQSAQKSGLEEVQSELAALKNENEALRAQITSVDTVGSESDSALQALMEENTALKSKLDGLDSLEMTVAELRVENEALKQAQAEQPVPLLPDTDELFSLEEENARLVSEIAALRESSGDSKELQEQLAALEEKNADLGKSLDEALKQAEKYGTEIAEKDRLLSAIRDEKEALTTSLGDKGGEHAQLAEMQAQIETLKTENERLRARIKELESAQSQIASLEEKVSTLQGMNESLQADLEQARSQTGGVGVPAEKPEKIAQLEKALQQADIEKQLAMQGLAREYIRLKRWAAERGGGPPERYASVASVSYNKTTKRFEQVMPMAGEEDVQAGDEDISSEELLDVSGPQEPVEDDLFVAVEEPTAEPESSETVAAEPAPVAVEEILAVSSEEDSAREPARTRRVISNAGDPALTEAQALEAELAGILEAGTPPQEPVSVRMSEDPFTESAAVAQTMEEEPMPTLQEHLDGTPYKEAPAQTVSEEEEVYVSRIRAVGPEEPDLRNDSADPWVNHRRKKRRDDHVAGIEAAPVPEAPAMQTAAVETQPPVMDQTIQKDTSQNPETYNPPFAITEILSSARIAVDGSVKTVPAASSPGQVAYQWNENNIFGSAEQRPLRNEMEFDTHVKEYIERTQARCQGDFAVVPDNTMQQGQTRIDSYEIACVGENINSSASLLFFNREGTFTVVAHESSTDHMSAAMDIRNRLLKTISGSSG